MNGVDGRGDEGQGGVETMRGGCCHNFGGEGLTNLV